MTGKIPSVYVCFKAGKPRIILKIRRKKQYPPRPSLGYSRKIRQIFPLKGSIALSLFPFFPNFTQRPYQTTSVKTRLPAVTFFGEFQRPKIRRILKPAYETPQIATTNQAPVKRNRHQPYPFFREFHCLFHLLTPKFGEKSPSPFSRNFPEITVNAVSKHDQYTNPYSPPRSSCGVCGGLPFGRPQCGARIPPSFHCNAPRPGSTARGR